jgi:hypothetical protein
MEAEDLVSVYTLNDPTQAELIKAALHDEGIACQIDGENQGSFSGVLQIAILVRAVDADRARRFIETHEHRE